MNVLIINKYFFVSGGPERYMFSVISALEKTGFKVIPLALKLDRNRDSPHSHNFLKPPFGSKVSQFPEATLDIIQKIRLAARSLYSSPAHKVVSQIIEKEKIDVIYLLNICNYIGPSVITAAKKKGVRVVMRLSDFNFICASYHFMNTKDGRICQKCKGNLFNSILHRCVRGSLVQSMTRCAAIGFHKYWGFYNQVDAYVCPSKLMARELLEFGVSPNRIFHLPSFIETIADANPSFIGRYALYFGRLSKEKGVDILIKAWKILGSNAPPLYIIGSGQEKIYLQQMSKRYLLNVKFIPFLKRDELMHHLRRCMITIIPSICHDNAPMAAIEAMAMGKVVIASKVGGLPDLIQDKKTGFLVEPGNPQALANAIGGVLNDIGLCSKVGNRAYRYARHAFSQQRHMDKLICLLSKPLSD